MMACQTPDPTKEECLPRRAHIPVITRGQKKEVNDPNFSTIQFQLFDLQGNLLQSERITGTLTCIAMGELVPAMYF